MWFVFILNFRRIFLQKIFEIASIFAFISKRLDFVGIFKVFLETLQKLGVFAKDFDLNNGVEGILTRSDWLECKKLVQLLAQDVDDLGMGVEEAVIHCVADYNRLDFQILGKR